MKIFYKTCINRSMFERFTKTSGTIMVLFALTFAGTTSAFAGSHVYKLYVDGLACPFCAYGVEKHVGGLDGVDSVDIQINEGIVAVTMKSNKVLDEAGAKKAVNDAGFTLRKFEGGKKQ